MDKSKLLLKKALVLNALTLGLDEEKAYILSELPQNEIDKLKNDIDFAKEVELTKIQMEKDLLERHQLAMRISAEMGKTKPIEWKLSKVNPKRWGNDNSADFVNGKKILVVSEEDERIL